MKLKCEALLSRGYQSCVYTQKKQQLCFTQTKNLVPRTKPTNLRLQTCHQLLGALPPQQQCWSNNTPVYCCPHLTWSSCCWSCQALTPVNPLRDTMEGHRETTLNIFPITCSTSLFLHMTPMCFTTSQITISQQKPEVHTKASMYNCVAQNTSRIAPALSEVKISLHFWFFSLVLIYVSENYWMMLWNLLCCSLISSVSKEKAVFAGG